ncbi:MAG: hypothetical protein WCK75_07495 [Elusimicrobiota bacterium]
MKEIDEKIKELEEAALEITTTRNSIINQLIKQWETNPDSVDELFYKLLSAEWKLSANGTAYGTQLEKYLIDIFQGVLKGKPYNIEKHQKIRDHKVEDIVITGKNSSPVKVVVEVKSFIENSTSSHSIRLLEKAKKDIEDKTDMKYKYFVFASSHSGNPSFESWKPNKDWIFLQSHYLSKTESGRIWLEKGFESYYPLRRLIKSIEEVFVI